MPVEVRAAGFVDVASSFDGESGRDHEFLRRRFGAGSRSAWPFRESML